MKQPIIAVMRRGDRFDLLNVECGKWFSFFQIPIIAPFTDTVIFIDGEKLASQCFFDEKRHVSADRENNENRLFWA